MRCWMFLLMALMVSLAGAQTLEKRIERAYHEAIKEAQKMKDTPYWYSLGLIDIAKVLAEAGQFDLANQTLRLAIKEVQKIDGPEWLSLEHRREIAIALAQVGEFDLAIQIAQKIEEVVNRSWALREIAKALVKAGQIDLAIQIAQKFDTPWYRL